jgi:hypothetical protein
VRDKIARLGINTVAGLRSLIDSAPADLARFLGADALATVRRLLDQLPADEVPGGFEPARIVPGAQLGPAPREVPANVDIDLRDRLFEELQSLRHRPDRANHRARITALEEQLNALLERD